ncbi:sensor histidine kinase [Streptomyces griseiscabiei]|uniref:histidine kinase n=1 Tax=Streptomyces griseiscabiei TaxID=2993540 RepID=A0ABU4L547_9ACTN|nr:nitrate- and nitrite sensing domain-containing protein [Streptomyces griseiscabiei]MBZ3901963.1 sensor histidine kinase [Streptomyces griseiscabiei]MDX2910836.1 nitrate- and nitrite sensing domain-containing protein [Streptomyces griseiscabiei]
MRTPRRTPTAGAEAPSQPAIRGRRAHAGPPADERLDPDEAEAVTLGPPTRAGRWHLRPRTVRAKIVCLLMVPVVSLLALWAYATVTTAQDVAGFRQTQRVDASVRGPVADAVEALQEERVAAVRYATAPSAERESALRRLSQRTERAVDALRLGDRHTIADGTDLPPAVAERLAAFVTGAEQLRALRTSVLDHRSGWAETYERYTRTVSTAFGVGGALTGVQDPGLGSDARVLLEFSRAGEALAQEDSLLAGARLAGTLDRERLRLFTGAVDTRRTLAEAAGADLRGPERAAWQELAHESAYADLRAVEDKVLTSHPGVRALRAAPEAAWTSAHARVRDDMRGIEAAAGHEAADRADPFTRALLTPAGAAVLLGLAAVVASLVISVRIGRGLVVELVGLRNGALEIARRKLPHAMRRLRAGEEIDVDAEAPPGPPAEDETGQVAEALGTVHRAALRAAVERAELAGGISGVFVNLARRSQILVHRQLSLLDSMERRSDDPDELSDLFRLDHLTTRMRRHAESLIILSGAAPGRAWRMPVSLTNVVRAAVSEIEDYARVEVRQLPEAKIVGTAVADLTHLLAELVENAAQFSPPHTRVRITGEPVGNGYVVEVEDRGLGMGKETRTEANRRIEQSEALDLFDSDRLGLFVVSRLSARHGVKVHLRTSPYGGTTAVVLLPTALLNSGVPERSPRAAAEASPRSEERAYARVAAGHQEPVERAADRRALMAPVASTTPGRTTADGPPEPPPGVTALRPHRHQPEPEHPDELPRRVRQAHLAPQLREQHTGQPAQAATAPADDVRTPELVRDRMTAYRDGWARGGGRAPGKGVTPGPVTGSDSSEGDPA